MEELHNSTVWPVEFLKFQNKSEALNFCNLKLLCSDGYVLCHRALIPKFQHESLSVAENQDALSLPPLDPLTSSDYLLTDYSLTLISKLVLMLYTGEAIISKRDHTRLKPLFEVLQLQHLKRHAIPGNSYNTRTAKNKCKPHLTDMIKKKVRAKRNSSEQFSEYDDIFIFGDGSEMAVPFSEEDIPRQQDTSICYNEEGEMISNDEDKGFYCAPCSMIFCNGSDYYSHTSDCGSRELGTSKVIKVECDFIKVESMGEIFSENSVNRVNKNANPALVGTISVCLVCVTGCKDSSELIIHSSRQHDISPEEDYDLASWKCKHCLTENGSGQLSVFFQHVVHCKTEKRKHSRKRSAQNGYCTSEKALSRKRRKVSSPIIADRGETSNESSRQHTKKSRKTEKDMLASEESSGSLDEGFVKDGNTIEPDEGAALLIMNVSSVQNENSSTTSEPLVIDKLVDNESFVNPSTTPRPFAAYTIPVRILETQSPSIANVDVSTLRSYQIDRSCSSPVLGPSQQAPKELRDTFVRSPISILQKGERKFAKEITSRAQQQDHRLNESELVPQPPSSLHAMTKSVHKKKNMNMQKDAQKILTLNNCQQEKPLKSILQIKSAVNFNPVGSHKKKLIPPQHQQKVNIHLHDSSSESVTWLKTKKIKKQTNKPTIPAQSWPCRQCFKIFYTQKRYMCHNCELRKCQPVNNKQMEEM